jgi:hypothetical protein
MSVAKGVVFRTAERSDLDAVSDWAISVKKLAPTICQSRLNQHYVDGDTALDLIVVAHIGLGWARGVVDVAGGIETDVSKCGQVRLFPVQCEIVVCGEIMSQISCAERSAIRYAMMQHTAHITFQGCQARRAQAMIGRRKLGSSMSCGRTLFFRSGNPDHRIEALFALQSALLHIGRSGS